MGKPFQFSMAQGFCALILLGIGLGELRWCLGSAIEGWNFVAALAAIGATFGASLGFMFQPPAFFVVACAVIGAIVFPLGWVICAIVVFVFFNPIRC
jgi:hypothetical protein